MIIALPKFFLLNIEAWQKQREEVGRWESCCERNIWQRYKDTLGFPELSTFLFDSVLSDALNVQAEVKAAIVVLQDLEGKMKFAK